MWKLIPLALLQSIFLCGGQVLLKLGLAVSGPFSWSWKFFRAQLTNWWFLATGVSLISCSILWMYILKKYPFSMAYPLASMSYVFGMLAAIFIFHEEVPPTRWLGVVLIMGGCYFIAK